MSQQSSTNPFGQKNEQIPADIPSNARPTLPPLEEKPVPDLANNSTSKADDSNIFSKPNETQAKSQEPVSYLKYMNGNSSTNNSSLGQNVPISQNLGASNAFNPKPLVTEIAQKRVVEDLPPLVTEVNIQEEANISVNNSEGVKKNVVVETPKVKISEHPEDLIKKELPPIVVPDKPKASKGKIITIVVIIVIVILLLALLSIPVLSALGTARNNAFSSLSVSLPVENLPVFNLIAKNPKLIIADIFNKPLSGNTNNKSLSEKVSIDMKIKDYKANVLSTYTLNLQVSNKNNASGSGKQNLNFGGTIDTNGNQIVIDPNSVGIETTTISTKEYYLKYAVTSEVKNLIFPTNLNSYYNSVLELFNKYNDKYVKFSTEEKVLSPDDPNFFKPKQKSPTSQLEAFQIDESSFYEEMNPKFKTFMGDNLLKADKVIDVVNEGRVKVQGVDSIKLRLKYDQSKFKEYQKELVSSSADFIYNNFSSFARLYCASSLRAMNSNSVKSSDIENCTNLYTTKTTREEVLTFFSIFNYIDFNNVVIYVNAENNDLTKLTIDLTFDGNSYLTNILAIISPSKVALIAPQSERIDPIAISLDYETIKSDKEINIVAPIESTSYEDFLKEIEKVTQSVFMLQ